MSEATQGDTVRVHYTGKLDDGSVFDSSRDGDPLEFTLGAGQVISGFEEAVAGMVPGDTTETEIPPEKGYGARQDDAVVEIPAERLPDDMDPEVGDRLEAQRQDGQVLLVEVVGVGDESVTVDANHPLAGKTLTFEIELVEIG